jgi:cytochrome c-type biogenesis protein CcmH/NrfG
VNVRGRADQLARYGWQALNAGDGDRGVAALKEAIALVPDDKDYWLAYAVALARTLRMLEATDAFRRCASLDPQNVAVWCMLGEVAMQRSDYAGAAQALKRCLELDPKAKHPHGLRARALIRRGEQKLGKK